MFFISLMIAALVAAALGAWVVALAIIALALGRELFLMRDDKMSLERKRVEHMRAVDRAIVECLVKAISKQALHGRKLVLSRPQPFGANAWANRTDVYAIKEHDDQEAVAIWVSVRWSAERDDLLAVANPSSHVLDSSNDVAEGLASLQSYADEALRDFALSKMSA